MGSKLYLIELSQSYKEAVILRIIIQEKICRPLDCTYLNDRCYCRDEDALNVTEVKQDGSIQITFLNHRQKDHVFFGVVATYNQLKDYGKRLLVSDFKSHSVTEIDEDGLELNVIVGQYDNLGFDDGPRQSRLLHSPVGIVCRGSSVYIAEHPTDRQRSIRPFHCLFGSKEFQSIWHLVSKAFGMVSRTEGWTNPEESNKKKNIKITDAKDLLELVSTRHSQLKGKISTLHGNMQLDISTGSMSGKTAVAVYDTLLSGVAFVIDIFNYLQLH